MGKEKDITLAERIKGFDFYKSLPRDLAEPTVSGATRTFLLSQISFSYIGCSVILFDGFDGYVIRVTNHDLPLSPKDLRNNGRC